MIGAHTDIVLLAQYALPLHRRLFMRVDYSTTNALSTTTSDALLERLARLEAQHLTCDLACIRAITRNHDAIESNLHGET
jgi:hypothetical protein